MISKQSILAAVQKIKEQQSRPQRSRLSHPERDWFILLTLTFISIAVLILWSVFVFKTTEQDSFTPSVQVEKVPSYKREMVKEIISVQQERTARGSQLDSNLKSLPAPAVETQTTPDPIGTETPLISN